jgi:hypothetical protein
MSYDPEDGTVFGMRPELAAKREIQHEKNVALSWEAEEYTLPPSEMSMYGSPIRCADMTHVGDNRDNRLGPVGS